MILCNLGILLYEQLIDHAPEAVGFAREGTRAEAQRRRGGIGEEDCSAPLRLCASYSGILRCASYSDIRPGAIYSGSLFTARTMPFFINAAPKLSNKPTRRFIKRT